MKLITFIYARLRIILILIVPWQTPYNRYRRILQFNPNAKPAINVTGNGVVNTDSASVLLHHFRDKNKTPKNS